MRRSPVDADKDKAAVLAPSPTYPILPCWRRPFLGLAVGIAVGLGSADVSAATTPIRVDYEAHDGCPDTAEFLREITGRTPLSRPATSDEEALEIRVRIEPSDGGSQGNLILGRPGWLRERSVDGATCEEVVSALALITALAIDPHAVTAPTPKREPEPRPTAATPDLLLPLPLPAPWAPPLPDAARAMPPTSPPARAPRRIPWEVGAFGDVAAEVLPRALFGGGIFVGAHLPSTSRLEGSLRLSLALATTGAFAVPPAGVRFTRGLARVDGCLFALRPLPRLSIEPCVAIEGGVFQAEGIGSAQVPLTESAVVPWAGATAFPRIDVDLGSAFVEAQGGPVFSLVKRTFVFDNPRVVIHEVPPVTLGVSFGAGIHFR